MRASGGPSICPTCRGLWGRSGCSPARSSPGAAAAGSEGGRVGEKGGFRGGPDYLKKKKELQVRGVTSSHVRRLTVRVINNIPITVGAARCARVIRLAHMECFYVADITLIANDPGDHP